MDTNRLLKDLVESAGVSGAEDEVRSLIGRELRQLGKDVSVDALGNVFATEPTQNRAAVAPRVMVAAHMDEVGLMITHIEEKGELKFQAVGGIDPRVLLAKTVRVSKSKISGVIGSKPAHLLTDGERDKVVKIEEMSIDIGAGSRKDAERLVKVGDYAVFDSPFGTMGNLVAGKALDDRVGCALLLDALGNSYDFGLTAVFTVQEEVGLRGAHVAAYSIKPQVAIVLETTVADDLPKDRDESPTTRLGGGPALTLIDNSVIADRGLVELFIRTAEELSIPFQIKKPLIGSTDAGAIQRTGQGVRTAIIAVPCRYLHAPTSVMDPRDFQNTGRLLKEVLQRLPDWFSRG